LGHAATLRFSSPLIEPDVQISRIRLSDWLHRQAHGKYHRPQASFERCDFFLHLTIQLFSDGPGSYSVFAGSSPITFTSPSSKARQKSGSFPPPALPGFNGRTTLSDSRQCRHLKATLRPLPSHSTGLPRLPEPPFRRAAPTTPADRAGAHVDCFPTHAAFPKWQEGRHPHCHFRGLLRLYSHYGPPDRSAAQRRPLSRGSSPCSYPHKPLVSYRINRQLSERTVCRSPRCPCHEWLLARKCRHSVTLQYRTSRPVRAEVASRN
jgi:hypothetical protein